MKKKKPRGETSELEELYHNNIIVETVTKPNTIQCKKAERKKER